MIRLTRLSGEPFILNAELIRYVEACPDTFITLIAGERVVVSESMDEVLRRTLEYQQQKHLAPVGPVGRAAEPPVVSGKTAPDELGIPAATT